MSLAGDFEAPNLSLLPSLQNKNDELNQQELMRKVAEKNEKTQAIEEQRLAIQAELSATLREIAASDAWLKVRPSQEVAASHVKMQDWTWHFRHALRNQLQGREGGWGMMWGKRLAG